MPDPFDALRRPSGPIDPRPAFAAELRARMVAELGDLLAPAATGSADPGRSDDDPATDPARSTVDLGRRKDLPMSTTGSAADTSRPLDPLVAVTHLEPYLTVRDGMAAIAFYRAAFGASVDQEVMMPDGRLGHAQLTVGDGIAFAIADEFPEVGIVGPATLGGSSMSVTLTVPDADAAYARALAAGATGERPVEDQFYGARAGTFIDPFGHRWRVQTPTEDLTADELRRRAQEL